jgi:nitrate reductase NapE component
VREIDLPLNTLFPIVAVTMVKAYGELIWDANDMPMFSVEF